MNPEELPLRDIHLPDPVGWWPPAPGWWLAAAALVLIVLLFAAWRRRRRARMQSPLYLARVELAAVRRAWQVHGDPQRLAGELSTWLRRVAMSLRTRHEAAALIGERWRRCLDDIAGRPVFTDDAARAMLDAPYRPTATIDGDDFLCRCKRWLDAAATRRKR